MEGYILAEIGRKLNGKSEGLEGLTNQERIRFLQLRNQFNPLISEYFDDDFPIEEYKFLANKANVEIYPLQANGAGSKLEDFLD